MAKSMTGFGRGEAKTDGKTLTVEIKSVNNRYCDVQVRLPRSLFFLEPQFRKLCRDSVKRGKLDATVVYTDLDAEEHTIHINHQMALSYDAAIRELAAELDRPWVPDVRYISQLPEVMSLLDNAPDVEVIAAMLTTAQTQALDELDRSKLREGASLTSDISAGCGRLLALLEEVKTRADQVPELYRERLQERLQTLLSPEQEAMFDEQRLAAEVLLFADKADVHEEIVRLQSHLEEMTRLVTKDEAIGKKMDFFCQEVNREINTIGSKVSDLDLTRQVVDMKAILETIREQVQNIE
ncbi:MAG TPA: YicC family protein [Clostridiaceae bacterium]|nr:YicC family protein [Clostridiaceae bacterium]